MRRTLTFGLILLTAIAATACGPGEAGTEDPDSAASANEEVVRRMTEAVNSRDWGALDEVVAADLRRHSAATPGVVVTNREEFKAFLRQDLAAVPDAQVTINFLFAADDMVAGHFQYSGTQTGQMGPFPPSGNRIDVPFIGLQRIEDGKVAEMWVEWDNLAGLTQLGHLSPPDVEASP